LSTAFGSGINAHVYDALVPRSSCMTNAIGSGVLEIDDRGERLVVDDHFVDGVARLGRAVRYDDRDRVADVAGLVDGDWQVRGILDVVGDRPRERHRVGPFAGEIGAGEHATTPGIALAAVVSIDRMRACACGLRTSATCNTPGMSRSAM
jgi:hypothetical protein